MKDAIPLIASIGASAATGGAAAPAAGGLFSTLSTVASVGSAAFSIFGGLQGLQAGRQESVMIKEQAALEQTRAAQEEANRQARLSQILSEGLALSAGRGGAIGSGSDLALQDFSMEEANRESGIAQLESKFQQQRLRTQAVQARRSGTASLISGLSQAGSTAATAIERKYERTRTQK